MINERFGEYLKKVRKERRFSLRELARRGEVSHAYLSQIENSERIPSLEIVKKLSSVLDIQDNSLLVKAGYVSELSEIEILEQQYKALTAKIEFNRTALHDSLNKLEKCKKEDTEAYKKISDEVQFLKDKLREQETRLQLLRQLIYDTQHSLKMPETIEDDNNNFNELLKKMPLELTKEFMKIPGHEITFDLPSYEEVTINNAKFTSYIPPEKAIEKFFEIENLLNLNLEALNFRGKKISKEQIEKIITFLTEDFK